MTSLQIAVGVWGTLGAIALYVTHSAHDIIAPRFVCGSVVMISALWFWIDLVRMAL